MTLVERRGFSITNVKRSRTDYKQRQRMSGFDSDINFNVTQYNVGVWTNVKNKKNDKC